MSSPEGVVVHRCVVRVVRHGGWTWGPDPRGLVDRVVQRLPGLLAEHLGRVEHHGGDLVVTEPVRIAVRLNARDLLQQVGADTTRTTGPVDPARAPGPVGAATPARIAATPRPPQPAGRSRPASPTVAGPVVPVVAADQPAPDPTGLLALLDFLAEAGRRGDLPELLESLRPATLALWHGELLPWPTDPGRSLAPAAAATDPWSGLPGFLADLERRAALPELLALLPLATLEAWHRVAVRATAGPGVDGVSGSGPPMQATGRLAALAEAAAAARTTASDPTGRARAGIAALGALAARFGAAEVQRLLDRLEPVDDALDRPGAMVVDPDAPTTAATATAAPSRPPPTVPAKAPGGGPWAGAAAAGPAAPTGPIDVEVDSALPFLLLGPLAQIGYLQTVAPALRAAGVEQHAAAFATGLAYAVLGPAERGWRRQPGDLAAAAAFVAQAEPPPWSAVLDLARAAAGALAPLDALLAGSLARGHRPGQPLVLTGTGGAAGGLVLADREGLFPIAWVDEVEQLLPWWRACGSPTVLVGQGAVRRRVVEDLQAAGVGFVIGVPPTQQERWRRLPPPLRLWTNYDGPPGLLARQAADFATVVERLDEVVDTLGGGGGRAGPRAPDPGLDRTLALAATLGLGTIAWTLWRDREPTDPLLALDRFGDLGARVRIDATRVLVGLPFGRRRDDLLEHGLLADVRGTPWLPSRVVEFSGG